MGTRDCPFPPPMRRAGPAAGVIALVMIAGWLAGQVAPALDGVRRAVGPPDGPVYTVADVAHVRSGRRRPWVGRPVLLRAVATELSVPNCPYPIAACRSRIPVLVDPGTPASAHVFLVWGLSDPLRASVRRLPIAGHFVPPQGPRWGRLATYRVALRPLPGAGCPTCVEAVLFDASPIEGL